jgi:hypothetical protein
MAYPGDRLVAWHDDGSGRIDDACDNWFYIPRFRVFKEFVPPAQLDT